MWRLVHSARSFLAYAWASPARRSHRFLGAWIRSPFAMGSLVPSSRALARAMVAQIRADIPGAIIELGAGTGVITQALVQIGLAPERLVIVERHAALHRLLCGHFPHLNVICADAAQLNEIVASLPSAQVNAIVSSLPLLSMPKRIRYAIEESMAAAVGPDSRIVQFTYGPKSPISRHTLRKYSLHGERVKTVLVNMPPAQVWVYKKAASGQ